MGSQPVSYTHLDVYKRQYYKQLKNKFAALDTEAKNSAVETNGGKVVAANLVS